MAAQSIIIVLLYSIICSLILPASSLPSLSSTDRFLRVSHSGRANPDVNPVFPDSPPSCPLCAASYSQISSCAQAAPVLANFSMIIFNPDAFIDVIKCSCTDTFQSTFPQCVDCFQQTNQTDILETGNLPAIVDGMRKICALESTLLGGVATADGEVTPTSSLASPTATSTSAGISVSLGRVGLYVHWIPFVVIGLELIPV